MNRIIFIILQIVLYLFLFDSVVYPHLCDNVFRQADKLIVKPENYNMIVKDEATFKVFLQNNMDRAIAEISLLAESSVFDFTITPDKMSIPKDQRVFFTVTLRPKSEVKTGSYPIHFRLLGKGREFESVSLDIQGVVEGVTAEVEKAEEIDLANLLTVKPTSHSLQLDGVLGEELWEEASVASNFSSLKGGGAIYQTVVLITYDEEYLYFGIHCLNDDSQDLVEGDKIELRLATESLGYHYHSIILPAEGSPSFEKFLEEEGTSPWQDHNIKHAIRRDKKFWTLELTIPFGDEFSPQQGKKIYLRIIRTKVSGEAEESYWAADSSGYNKEEGFGEFILVR